MFPGCFLKLTVALYLRKKCLMRRDYLALFLCEIFEKFFIGSLNFISILPLYHVYVKTLFNRLKKKEV